MKFPQLALAALLAGLTVSPAVAFDAYRKPVVAHEALPALALRAIEAATPELHKLKPDWQTYQVQAAETADALVVSFWQKQPPAGSQDAAAAEGHADFVVVVLDKETLNVTNIRQFSL